MALVLCTGVDPVLLQRRKLILEQAGHTVISVKDQRELTAACNQHQFDVALIGQAVSHKMKKIIASLIRKACPSTKILELHPSLEEKSVDEADAWMEIGTDVPRELAQRVTELAEGKQHDGASA